MRPRTKWGFTLFDQVRPSVLCPGSRRWRNQQHTGRVVGFGRHVPAVWVRWEGQQARQRYATQFIERVVGGERVEVTGTDRWGGAGMTEPERIAQALTDEVLAETFTVMFDTDNGDADYKAARAVLARRSAAQGR